MPNEWTETILCPIFKKGHKLLCDNYKGIAFLQNICIGEQNIMIQMNEIVGDYRCRFCKGRGVIDQIITIKETQVESYEFQEKITYIF